MKPPSETVHWLFATGFLVLGLTMVAETLVGTEVWRRRSWRAYFLPVMIFLVGIALWPVMVFFTNSTMHMLAHGIWAQTMTLAGAAQLGLARGKLQSRLWELTVPVGLVVSGVAFLIHEQNGWLFARSAFIHHAMGWTLIVGAVFPLGRFVRPRAWVFSGGYAMMVLALAVLLYSDRDLAPIFGHLSELAGPPP